MSSCFRSSLQAATLHCTASRAWIPGFTAPQGLLVVAVLCRWVLDSGDLEREDIKVRVEELKHKGAWYCSCLGNPAVYYSLFYGIETKVEKQTYYLNSKEVAAPMSISGHSCHC
jgi:hypothetical protein